VYVSSHALEQRARAMRQSEEWKQRLNSRLAHKTPKIFVGPIAAGEKVVASSGSATAEMIRRYYGDALAVEMEGRGFLGGVHLNHEVRACIIRGISDVLDGKAEADASGSQERAADAASAVAMEILVSMRISIVPGSRSEPEAGSIEQPPQQTKNGTPVQTNQLSEASAGQNRQHVVILVHGIRDFALWQNSIRRSLKNAGFGSASINYGRFNLIEFLLPISFFRRRAIEEVWNQMRVIKKNNPEAKISVIAHSFGTYVVAHLMQKTFDIKFHRVIFCGSVVRYNFPFEQIDNRFDKPIINEVGTRDIWPAIAESITTGYGSAGTYGFRRELIEDRWHNGAQHGFFLTEDFCKTFWIPWLEEEKFIPGAAEPEAPSLWIRVLSTVKLKYLFLVGLVLILVGEAYRINLSDYLRAGAVSIFGTNKPALGTNEATVYGPTVRIATDAANPGCSNRAARSCAQPERVGGRLKAGSARAVYTATDQRFASAEVVEDSPTRICIEFRVTTNVCENRNALEGRASAIEQY
jgi:hypothetical protein